MPAPITRPPFADIHTAAEFDNWYWLKSELLDICRDSGLRTEGSKAVLRKRVLYALTNDGARMPEPASAKPTSTFDWARAELSRATIITDNVRFGPNLRGFLQSQVTGKFSCTGEFMAWCRENAGATLGDALDYYHLLRSRRADPEERRDIVEDNQYNRYVRAFLDDNPRRTMSEARPYWLKKRALPAPAGRVTYAREDLRLR